MTRRSENDPTVFAEEITGQVHDYWLDVEEIDFNRNTHELRIPVRVKATSPAEKTLVISTVRNVDICDTERIGRYPINTIRIDLMNNRIKIRCGIPLRIDVFVIDPFRMNVEHVPHP